MLGSRAEAEKQRQLRQDCNMVDSAAGADGRLHRRMQNNSRPDRGGLAERCRDIDPLLLGRCREELYACFAGHAVLIPHLTLTAAASSDKNQKRLR